MLEECEQVAAHLTVTFSQPPAMEIGRCKHHDRVQLVTQPALIAAPGALGQLLAPARQYDGSQQHCLHTRGKDRVARFDGVFAIAQLVRQADLPQVGMPLLGAVEIGDPDAGPMTRHCFGDYTGGAAVVSTVAGSAGPAAPVSPLLPVHSFARPVQHPLKRPQGRPALALDWFLPPGSLPSMGRGIRSAKTARAWMKASKSAGR
jgi:hypothetical protein